MPPIAAVTVGVPGAGKTTRGLEILSLVLEQVIQDPMRVGYVSFTRSARRVASTRAGDKFGVKAADLEKDGWFRTLHSCAYRCLAVQEGQLLAGSSDDNAWLADVLQDDRARFSSRDYDDDYFAASADQGHAGRALAIWDCARNRQMPVEAIWRASCAIDNRTPDLDLVQATVDLYEAAKARDKRLDFTDLLMRFAGRAFSGDHNQPFAACEPQGDFPILPVWFHDEAQDMSELTALVFRRLTYFSRFVYLLGDDYQAIYTWAGSDGKIMANWPAQKREVLGKSHRCSQKICNLATRIISKSYPKRHFEPARDGGEVVYSSPRETIASLKPGEDALVLARTNALAQEMAQALDDELVPWKPIKGSGGYNAPARAQGVMALEKLRRGNYIDGEDWWRVLQLIPAKLSGTVLLVRGTKKRFEEPEARRDCAINLAFLDYLGGTEALASAISSGQYVSLLEAPAAKMAQAAMKHGTESIGKPSVQVGTLHASKGMEADRVVLLDTIAYPTQRAMEEEEGLADERRLWFTGVTRARHKLTVAQGDGAAFEEL